MRIYGVLPMSLTKGGRCGGQDYPLTWCPAGAN
jgi:hypothetical protein